MGNDDSHKSGESTKVPLKLAITWHLNGWRRKRLKRNMANGW